MILKTLNEGTEKEWKATARSASWSEEATLTLTSGHVLTVNSYTTQGYEEEKDISRLTIDFGNGACFSKESSGRSVKWMIPLIEIIIQDLEG